MNGDSVDDVVVTHRPPAPEVPPQVRAEQERQQIFHSYASGSVQHGGPQNPARGYQSIPGPGSGPIWQGDVCVLDERGGHRSLGQHCPHQLGYNSEVIYEVEL